MATTINGFLSINEAAKIIGVSGGRVRCFIRNGRLKAEKVGARTYVVPRSEVEKFAQKPRRDGRPPSKKAG